MIRAYAFLLILLLSACAAPKKLPDTLALQKTSFSELPGWQQDRQSEALAAFLKSCTVFQNQPADKPMQTGGRLADWQPLCRDAAKLPSGDNAAARTFFESAFTPYLATNNGDPEGLFTGYYVPLVEASRHRNDAYQTPLYARPADLITVELGQFRDSLKGERIAGKIDDNALIPYADRAAIDAGALQNQAEILYWAKDPVAVFFLQIQGSGIIRLPDGTEQKIGYAATNGHIYTAIGKILIERGEVAREDMSMPAIKNWLREHPDEAQELLHHNASYVFFRKLEGNGVVGAQGVELTDERSLAVDRRFIDYGIPLWLATETADPDAPSYHRLLIAQDTGGAIRGPIRGDIFFGSGERAEHLAGVQKAKGSYWLLLPKAISH